MPRIVPALLVLCLFLSVSAERPAIAQGAPTMKWVTTWAASAQGPYPSGNPSAQPNQQFTFPVPANGARDQTFRMIVRPDVWGGQTRIRFTNVFGVRPLTIEDAHVGVQLSGAAVLAGTNQAVRFSGQSRVVIAPGQDQWSDPVRLAPGSDDRLLNGRKMAVSFHVVGESGPMTWHAKALTTSYLSAPGASSAAATEDDERFPFTTTSWFFVDAVDMMLPADTKLIVAFGDSITDGTASTLNGDDRWPDVLSRRLHRIFGSRAAVVNAGIGGNQVAGPAAYSATTPFSGGPSAGQRLDRDVLSLSGVSAVVWLEGINDFGASVDAPVDVVTTAMREVVVRIRERIKGVTVVGATLVSALRSANAAHGSPAEDQKRQALNSFIRTSGLFDAVADFDAATLDRATGELKPEFVPDSTTGGTGDRLHPNRAGYLAMGQAVDINKLGIGTPGR